MVSVSIVNSQFLIEYIHPSPVPPFIQLKKCSFLLHYLSLYTHALCHCCYSQHIQQLFKLLLQNVFSYKVETMARAK